MNDKKTHIIEATIKLFAKDGVGVATSQIAKEANVSNGTLFNYFTTKQDLVDNVYLYIKERMANEITNELGDNVSMHDMFFILWKHYILWAHKNPLDHQVLDLLRFSQTLSTHVIEASEHLFADAYEVIDEGIKNKHLIDVPIAFYSELTSAALMAIVHYTRKQQLKEKELHTLIEKSFSIYWNGISRNEKSKGEK